MTLGPANILKGYSEVYSKMFNFNAFKVDYAYSVWIENCYITRHKFR